MKTNALLLTGAIALLLAAPVHAQKLLKKLQERIEKAAQRTADDQRSGQSSQPVQKQEPGQAGFVADDHGKAQGIEILTVDAGGSAALAGLQKGDTIVTVDGRLVKTLDDLAKMLAGRKVNERLRLGIVRKGQLLEQTISLQPPRGPVPPGTAPAAQNVPKTTARPAAVLGVTVEPLTESLRRRFQLSMSKGALITSIAQGSAADRYQLPIGGVIITMNNQRIDGPDDLRRAIAATPANSEVEILYQHQNRLYRRKVMLAPAVVAKGAPPLVPIDRGYRPPVLDRLERVLERVVERPKQANDEVLLLRRQLELLKGELQILRQRVEKLEKSPPATKKSPPAKK